MIAIKVLSSDICGTFLNTSLFVPPGNATSTTPTKDTTKAFRFSLRKNELPPSSGTK